VASKSLRFEVFARDAFTCQYCGARPPDVVLELDHIHPRSKGGGDDLTNLITSCFDCNRGKRAKVISDVAPRPDADLAFLRVQQEIVEVQRFLSAKKKLDAVNKKLCDALRDSWAEKLTSCVPTDRILLPWIHKYGPREVEAAILAAVPAYNSNRFGFDEDRAFNKLLPWIGAILRNREQDREGGAIQ
jgi:hypothetical protein